MWGEEVKVYSIWILLMLIYYQFKIRCYKFKTFYVSPMVTTTGMSCINYTKELGKKCQRIFTTKDVKTYI